MKSRASLGFLLFGLFYLASGLSGQTLLPPIAEGNSAENCLLITEILYNSTQSDDEHEWIELSNRCEQTIDISNYKLGDEETREGGEGMVRFPDETFVEGRRSIVIAQSAAAFRERWGFLPNFALRSSSASVPILASVSFVTGAIQLANGGDELIVLDAANALVDGLSYGDSSQLFSPSVALAGRGESLARIPAHCDRDSSADFQPQTSPTPGAAQFVVLCETDAAEQVVASRGDAIGRLQGRSDVSPVINQTVTFEGVVTGFHQDRNAAGAVFYTLFVQDLVGQEDGDPLTSDALPVFLGRNRPQAKIGDHVRVQGQVVEFYGLTEISHEGVRIDILSEGQPLPSPIEIDPQTSAFEALEGMRVRLDFEPARVVGPTFSGCGFTVVRQDSGVQRILRRTLSDPIKHAMPVMYRSDVDCEAFPQVKTGDEISGLHGLLIYNFDQFKILVQETDELIVDETPFQAPPQMPMPTMQQFSVTSFNVENLFDGIDDTGSDAEPKLSPEALQTKVQKIGYTLSTLLHCPTVVALQEVEKETLSEMIAAEAASVCGFQYDVVHLESADGRGIDLAFLLDGRRVSVISAELSQTCTAIDTGINDSQITCPDNEQPLFSRQPLVLDVQIDGKRFALINNHLKSKRGGEIETAPRREAQAAHLRDLASQRLSEDPAAEIIVLGDLNDYEDSKPLQILADSGLVNALKQVPDEERYSFVFSGISQLIDGVLLSPTLVPKVAFVSILHTNADYPDVLGEDVSAEKIAFKSTDHDLPYLVLNLAEEVQQTTVEPTSTPLATPAAEPNEQADDTSLFMVGGALLVGFAAAGGYWFGRKRSTA
ncbi:MAG: lamin tail domain-containing protein [Candidatus Promineifilaceae bacterium]